MLGQTMAKVVPVTLALALVFSVLAHFWACNPGKPWWRKRELVTDLCYWFLVPLFARVFRIGLLVLGAGLLFGIHDADDLIAFYDNGHGPLSTLPLWLQAVLFLVAADFMMYWLHRMFHGGGFWKYHAIHHSSEDVDWISAARFHPVNLLLGTIGVDVVLLMAGISPNVMLWLGPFNIFHSAFVHANLNWTLGPFRYVVATPVFHRWHHTSPRRGRRHQFRRHLSALGHPVRNLPDAGRPAAGPLWRRGSVLIPERNRRAAGLSVPQIEPGPQAPGCPGNNRAGGCGFLGPISAPFAVRSSIDGRFTVSGAGSAAYRFCRLVTSRSKVCRSSPCVFARARVSAFLSLATAILLWPAVSLAAPDPDPIAVNVDQAKLVRLPAKVATIVVGNPLIADVTLQTGGIIVVTGKGYGATNFIAMDRAGEVLVDRHDPGRRPDRSARHRLSRRRTRNPIAACRSASARITLGDGDDLLQGDDRPGRLALEPGQRGAAAAKAATEPAATGAADPAHRRAASCADLRKMVNIG